MELFFIGLGTVLIIILAILIFFLFQRKKSKVLKKDRQSPIPSLQFLEQIIDNQNTNTQELKNTVDLIIKYYAEIDDIDNYMDTIFNLSKHPNTDTQIIVNFTTKLEQINPRYKSDINSAMSKGLNSR